MKIFFGFFDSDNKQALKHIILYLGVDKAKDKIVPHSKPDVAAAGGLMAEIEEGFTIGWRPFSSTESASVDIHITELHNVIRKFKFPDNL